MTRSIEFNIPTKKGVEQARGAPVWFKIGERKIRFVLQYGSDGKARSLTHFASGYRLGSLNDARVELMCKLTPGHRFSREQLARFLIDKAVSRIGVDTLLARLDAVPVINGENR